jgi:hypothetical protein
MYNSIFIIFFPADLVIVRTNGHRPEENEISISYDAAWKKEVIICHSRESHL